MTGENMELLVFKTPVRTPGFKSRIRPPYPQRVVKRRLKGRRYIGIVDDTA